MKDTTVHFLVIARALLERSESLCLSADRYLASAGLVILQDALEAVFYALLIELGVDEGKNLERKSFDELVGELKNANVLVPKSGTLKALNKQRVLTKHYAQLAEPITVRTYFEAASTVIESICQSVLGRSIFDLFIADILVDSAEKFYLKKAEYYLYKKDYLFALIEIRKAIFVVFEEEYSVYGWRDYDGVEKVGLLMSAIRGGLSAPEWKRRKDWIEKNIRVPTDYIQIDYNHWNFRAINIGIHTIELQNILRLTPAVFRMQGGKEWSVTYDASFSLHYATELNTRYCLDRTVSFMLKKQEHENTKREIVEEHAAFPSAFYLGKTVFFTASTTSTPLHIVSQGFIYKIYRVVGGFNPLEVFYEVSVESEEQSNATLLGGPVSYYRGYLQKLPNDGI